MLAKKIKIAILMTIKQKCTFCKKNNALLKKNSNKA